MFCADPALAEGVAGSSLPEGFAGRLSFRGPERLGYDETVSALQRLGMLISWAQAQQARAAARLEVLFARDIAEASGGREEPALAMSLAAAEASAALNIPHMTAMQLISESSRLCSDAPETLARLTEGKIALQHARIILEETHNLPVDVLETPEADAGAAADSAPAGDVGPGCPEQLDLGLAVPGTAEGPGAGTERGAGAGAGAGPEAGTDGPGAETADGRASHSGGEAASETSPHSGPGPLSVRAAFERDLLTEAEGRTAAGFGRRARRLRESRFPDLIPVRHRQAKDKRRVMFQPLPDGMSCLSAIIAAEKGQAMFAALTSAAKTGKHAGDPRTMDQLRADTLTELLLEGEPRDLPPGRPGDPVPSSAPGLIPGPDPDPVSGPGSAMAPGGRRETPGRTSGNGDYELRPVSTGTETETASGNQAGTENRPETETMNQAGSGTGTGNQAGTGGGNQPGTAPAPEALNPAGLGTEQQNTLLTTHAPKRPRTGGPAGPEPDTVSGPGPAKRPRRAERHRNRNRSTVRTEVMVLINADTLAGLDENPAELNGYGPVSAETARSMILDALHWTPLAQDPATGEILSVGRTRRIPAGLKRWLQARDGTCRFPGCSVSVTHAEIDHTQPFSHGGPTEHSNLEHLCPKHHRFKTLGHWTARQPAPGTIEWDSPTGRTYATDPALALTPRPQETRRDQSGQNAKEPDDDPPPF